MYIVVVAICAIILAFERPPYPLLADTRWVLAAVAAGVLAPVIAGLWTCRRTLRLIERYPHMPSYGQAVFGRGMVIAQVLLAVGNAALLIGSNWIPLCHQTPLVGGWLIVLDLLAGLPVIITIMLVWAVTYPAYRAMREIALETYVFRGKPVHPVWGLLEYLSYNLRHQVLFIVAPMFLILAAREVIEKYDKQLADIGGGQFPSFLLGTATACVAVIAPVILRYVWTTQRLPNGPLRDRLVALCKRLKLRYRQILVWRSGGMMVNAAVMGVLAPFRYLLITDGMIEQMDDQNIEAVFGHEAGHVKRHHILFFLHFALISGSMVTIVNIHALAWSESIREIASVLVGAVLLLKWGVIFGWISRNFERQADVFGVRTLALAGLPCTAPCQVHNQADSNTDETPTARQPSLLVRKQLCSTAAEIFAQTLQQVAVLNGIPPEARSWRHGSIASRCRILPKLAHDPDATARFEKRVLRIKLAIFAVASTTSLWAAYEMKLWLVVRSILNQS